ncbi:hypothetical protein [Alicyclobacillus ferrooxydans]|uniref:Uncharacterized protein n=1 Tax=Alicyclobacillus ferrooxydans TaxID=471514 RepID=A0A0P9EQ23_9BACL|nr:hypothetical protein [Alicyclobacillus ferrooxydans]KPV45627.1 hypothetical protein AN477_01550 [Alicyclobacillus ferrooxydans]
MHWLIIQIRDLPWWIPGVTALAIYWIPKVMLWPLRRLDWVHILVEEQAEMLAVMALVGFYSVYVLSKTSVPMAEIALFIVTCGTLGGLVWLCMASATFFVWLIRLPANTASDENLADESEGIEGIKQTWHNNFRVLQGGKDG